MNRKFLLAATLGLGLAMTGGAVALAQGGYQCPMGGMGGGYGMHKMGKGHGFDRMCNPDHEARQAGMLAYAEKKLGITDAQRDAWNGVVAAVKAGGDAMAKACAAAKPADPNAPQTLPQRLDVMQSFATLRAEQAAKAIPAVKALYEKLTPEQKTIADSFFNRGMGGMGGGMGPGMGGPGMGGPGMGPGMGMGGPGRG